MRGMACNGNGQRGMGALTLGLVKCFLLDIGMGVSSEISLVEELAQCFLFI